MEKSISMFEQAGIAVLKKSFPRMERIVDPLMQMKVELKQLKETSGKRDEGTTPEQGRHGCVAILSELSNKIPLSIDVEATRLILNPGNILLSGSTKSFNDVDRIKGLLWVVCL